MFLLAFFCRTMAKSLNEQRIVVEGILGSRCVRKSNLTDLHSLRHLDLFIVLPQLVKGPIVNIVP